MNEIKSDLDGREGIGIDEPLSQLRSGTVNYYEQDGLGSVTSLSSTGGTLANTYLYDSFGNVTNFSGTVTSSYQYTGRDYDLETGLRYYRARFLDTSTGRFLSEDPLEFGGGVNFYPYVGNRSTNLVDPLGLQSQAPISTPPTMVPNPTPQQVAQALEEIEKASKAIPKAAGPAALVGLAYVAVAVNGYYSYQATSAEVNANQAYAASDQAIHNLNQMLLARHRSQAKCSDRDRRPGNPGNGDDDCGKQWKDARAYCAELAAIPRSDPEWKHYVNIWGGSYSSCVRGQVTQRCGGSRIE